MVRAELHLKPVRSFLPRRVHDSGVVDQQIDALEPAANFFRSDTNGVQRSQIKLLQFELSVLMAGSDVVDCLLALVEISHCEYNRRAPTGQRACRFKPESRVGAGHDRYPPRLISDVFKRPLLVAHIKPFHVGSCSVTYW